jgi:hypothetical protein
MKAFPRVRHSLDFTRLSANVRNLSRFAVAAARPAGARVNGMVPSSSPSSAMTPCSVSQMPSLWGIDDANLLTSVSLPFRLMSL